MPEYKLDQSLIDEVEKKFSTKFKNRILISNIIESAAENKNHFEDLLFTSKYMMGVIRALSKEEHQSNTMLKSEFVESTEKIKNTLKLLLADKYTFLQEEYFSKQSSAVFNLISLTGDLELIKLYINDIKRGG
jgi:hypothetical protein